MTATRSAQPGVARADAYEALLRAVRGVVKRTLDVLGAVGLLMVTVPVLLTALAAVRFTSPGPVIFRQNRLGRDGRPFVMLKIRTMRDGCPDAEHRSYIESLLSGTADAVDGLYKLQSDSRVTPVGSLLRRTSIDELPQLWNVLRGHMSLVGPRPVLAYEAEMFPDWAERRFEVRPGLTGLWQVSGRNRLTMLDGLALDVEYVERHGVLLDLLILLRTVRAVVGRDAR